MGTYFASEAILNTSKAFTYFGDGYQYTLRDDGPQGTRVKLRVRREILNKFMDRVWKHVDMAARLLMVAEISNGWYLVTVLDEMHSALVTKFLAKFNRWRLRRQQPQTASQVMQALVTANNALHKTYELIIGQRYASPVSQSPKPQALQSLTEKFSKPRQPHYVH